MLRRIAAEENLRGTVADTAELLASELATNVVHAYRPLPGLMIVAVGLTDRSLLVAVADIAPGTPQPRSAGDEAEGGRGLAIVQSLASGWGWYRLRACPLCKVVWFSLRLDMPEPASASEPDLGRWTDAA
jgi:anti-sigma regulatory factor (Ser/Thr protein kinase)